ncbi:hypothetical protein Aperf_G00000088460 [Anoplocephala perfoliata]
MVDCEALCSRSRKNWPMTLSARKSYLKSLFGFVCEKEEKISNAVAQDIGRPHHEIIMSEISSVKYEIRNLLKHLKSWTKPTKVPKSHAFRKDKCQTELQALGTVLVIGSWSTPFQSVMIPLVGAIAAGNCVIIKPNELSAATGRLLDEQIPKYLDRSICQVLTCTLDETQDFLETNRMNFIYFAGVSNDGTFVMRNAAETLTPVCLDLSGKCPAYIDGSADTELAAKRIMWGKVYNCGQSPLAPDYALCHSDVQPKFLRECKEALVNFFNEVPIMDTVDYGRIASQAHAKRLKELMLETEGRFVFGGLTDVSKKFIQPTVYADVVEFDVLMQHEIYGPILPVITVDSSDEAMEYVNNLPKPQAVYVFTSEKEIFQSWKKNTSSGGIVLNDVVMFKGLNGMTFGGVGDSGMGRFRGQASIELFSHQRGVIERSTKDRIDKKIRYPPYFEKTTSSLRSVFKG